MNQEGYEDSTAFTHPKYCIHFKRMSSPYNLLYANDKRQKDRNLLIC